MKARPILFNTDMVKAILAGQKTQTRRGVKSWKDERLPKFVNGAREGSCPFGQPGDLLYVRETFAKVPRTAYAQSTGVTQIINPEDEYQAAVFRAGWERCKPGAWIPSIHMPRWASRLTLEITDVRVERLHEISEEDARAEGITDGGCLSCGESEPCGCDSPHPDARDAFIYLWDSIYSNWHANPWVWVVEFKAHHCNVDALIREREAA